jgi:hypothetical protein
MESAHKLQESFIWSQQTQHATATLYHADHASVRKSIPLLVEKNESEEEAAVGS